MRINEIEDKYSFGGYQWTAFGSGSKSKVYVRGNKALKVFNDDPHYSEWLSQIQKIQANPFVPKIYDIGANSDGNWVVMERLSNFRKNQADYWSSSLAASIKIGVSRSLEKTLDSDLDAFLQVVDLVKESINKGFKLDLHTLKNVMSRSGFPVYTDVLGD